MIGALIPVVNVKRVESLLIISSEKKKSFCKEKNMIYQKVLDWTDHIPIKDMDHEEWLEKRRSFIGGSDAGAILELSDYGSKLTVYLEKKGKAKTEENDAMLRGSIMEPFIRQITQKEFPDMQIEEAPFIFRSKENPFMGANVDGFILYEGDYADGDVLTGCYGLGIHEIKTSQDGYGFGADEVPDSYYAQCQHYMAVLNLPWAVLTVYIIAKNKIRHYPIMRNDEFIARLIAEEANFWNNHFLRDEWPAARGIKGEDELITGMFEGGMALVLGDAEKELCRQYVEASARAKEAEAEKERISSELKAAIVKQQSGGKEEKKISALAGKYSISWSRYMRHSIDTEALKKDGIYERYSKISESGMFRITEKKA